MSAKRVIGVDLGGTKILAGSDRRRRDACTRRSSGRPSTTSQDALLDELASSRARRCRTTASSAVGFGIPSRIDHERGIALGAVNIPLRDVALRDEMEQRLGLPVGIENDASCAAYAEFRLGAGRGTRRAS